MTGALLPIVFALAAQDAPADASSPREPPPEAPASETEAAAEDSAPAEQAVTIVGRRKQMKRIVGSAHTVDSESLERFEPDDIQRAVRGVPGVYVRDEDGQGLRPNIGLRGASSERSAKIALLEDGVLFAPAPYSAPAAYYFPLTARIVAIEVFKGPAAIRQGPHTVGGAINLRTRPVPMNGMGMLDVGVGLVGPGRDQSRLHGAAGVGDETWGVLIEGARVESDGFRRIDGDPDASTGFLRDDLMLKARIGSPLNDELNHNLELKLGFGREESDETYLGLSDVDFRNDPLRRYAASATDHMEWTRTQAQLRYTFELGNDITLDAVAYRHDLHRKWNKVNGVRGAPPLHDVLSFADVGSFPLFVAQLKGAEDTGEPGTVLIGPNDRTYYSHGIATVGRGRLVLGTDEWAVEQDLEVGLRLHQDGIKRLHTERAFTVRGATVVDNGEEDVVNTDNQAQATALAAHIADEIRFFDFVLVPGARLELIRGTFIDNKIGAPVVESDQMAILPGVGLAWQPWRPLILIAGVHRGFSPIAPGQSKDTRPEESTNVEGGVRFDLKKQLGLSGEAIGFYSQYENILGECTYSSGCIDDIGTQTNGGAAGIGGLELVVRHDLPLPWGESKIRSEATYTFTRAVFLTTFNSTHPLFSRVTAGDEMAYVPAHQAAFTGAFVLNDLDVGASVGLISQMRDVPGQGEALPHEVTDAQAVIDVAASYEVISGVRIAIRADNVLDQRAIVSRRPFGARPGKPRSVLLSLELETP